VKMGLHKRPGPAHFFSLCLKTHWVIFFIQNSQVSSASSSRAWPPTPESPPTALFIIRPLLPAIRSESPSRTRQARSSSSPATMLREWCFAGVNTSVCARPCVKRLHRKYPQPPLRPLCSAPPFSTSTATVNASPPPESLSVLPCHHRSVSKLVPLPWCVIEVEIWMKEEKKKKTAKLYQNCFII